MRKSTQKKEQIGDRLSCAVAPPPYPFLAECYGMFCPTRDRDHMDIQHVHGLHTKRCCLAFFLNVTMAKSEQENKVNLVMKGLVKYG